MATTVKEVLLKWGIDNSNWKKAIQELSAMLEKANKQADAASTKATQKLEAQKAKLKEYIADQKSETTEIQKQITSLKAKAAASGAIKAEAAARLATEKLLTAETLKQLAQEKVVQAQQRAAQAQINTQLASQRLITAQLNAQTAALRQQAVAARAAQGGGGRGGGGGQRREGGGGGNIFGRLAGGLFGGGPFGMIAGAVASAEGFEHAIELALDKLKEFSKEVGPLQQVREQFEKLAGGRGIQEPAKFIDDLRKATHGLVNDMALYRGANTFMQSSIHASNEDIVALTKATVGLARAQGRDATQAVQSLQRFFLTGRSMTLAYATGINRAYLAVGGLGHATDATIKTQVQFKQALEAVTKQYEMIGEPAETYTEKLTKVGVAAYRVLEEFMLGLESSKGFSQVLTLLDKISTFLGNAAENAVKFGEVFGNYLGTTFSVTVEEVTALWEILVQAFKETWSILGTLYDAFAPIVTTFLKVIGLYDTLSASSGFLKERFSSVTGALTTVGEGFVLTAAGVKELLNVVDLLVEMGIPELKKGLLELIGLVPVLGDISNLVFRKTYENLQAQSKEALSKFIAQEKEIAAQFNASYQRLEAIRTGGTQDDYKIKFAAAPEIFTTQQQIDAEKKYAKIKEQLAIETSKIELEYTKLRIADELELVKQQYEKGLIALQNYIARKRSLEQEEIAARIKDARAEYDARHEALEAEVKEQKELAAAKLVTAKLDKETRLFDIERQKEEISKRISEDPKLDKFQKANKIGDLNDQYTKLQQLINDSYAASLRVAGAEQAEIRAKELLDAKKYQLDLAKINSEGAQKERADDEELLKDRLAARKKLIDELEKLDKDRIEIEKTATDKQFADGAITAQAYLDKKSEYIEREYNAVLDGEKKKLEAAKGSLEAQAEFDVKTTEAAMARQKAYTQLLDNEWDVRTKAANEAVGRITSVLEAQLAGQQAVGKASPFSNRASQLSIITSLIAAERAHLEILQQQSVSLAKQPKLQAENQAEIEKTKEKLLSYEEELIKTRDYSQDLANEARNLATAASLFPKGGKTAQGLEKYAQITETIGKLTTEFKERIAAQKGGKVVPKTPEDIYKALEAESNKAASSIKSFTDAAKAAADAAVETVHHSLAELFPESLDIAIRAVNDFAGSLTYATKYQQDRGTLGDILAAPQEGAEKLLGSRAGGGGIPQTGPYQMHEGEYVLPNTMAGVFHSFISALSELTKTIEQKLGLIHPTIGASVSSGAKTGFALSGLPTPDAPGGTMTASDMGSAKIWQASDSTPIEGGASTASSSLSSLGGMASSLGSSFKSLITNTVGSGGLIGAFKNLGKNNQEASKDLGNFSKGLAAITGAVGGIMQTFKTSGGFQGAMAGAASFGQMGSAIGGPVGGVIGTAVGAIVGGISGAMRAATDRMAERLTAAFNAVIQEVQTGNQTLGAGISLSIQQIQATVSALSGRKGGRDDLKQILPNMEQQLAQLQQQQKQVLQSMDAQVSALNAPLAYQGQLGSIQTIITSYQQYIQAGGNVVTANQYLQDSFKNLATQGMQQLNQDEQDAVNNALNYNNLLLQRQELIQNTNSQIQQIMSQGVAVRQMPEGVSKAIQIQQLMLNNSQQMDQLNQQISVSQYQLTVQQKIFGLATTRIGLENQLVILQNEQTDYSMQQIEALGAVVGALSTKLPTSMQAAEQQLGFGPAFVNPGTEPGLMPTPPVKTGISQIDLQNQLQYQQALAAWQLSQNFPIGYIPTSGNVSTTPVPTTIGNPTTYTGSGGPSNPIWMQNAGPGSLLGIASGAATSFNTALSAANTLPTNVMNELGTSGLTVNGTQVDTVPTSSGNALLVAPENSSGVLQVVPIVTGPGTIQGTGIVGTATQVASATSSLFDTLSGASNTLIKATTPIIAPTAAEMVTAGQAPTATSGPQPNTVSTPAGLALLVSTVSEAMNGVGAAVGTVTGTSPGAVGIPRAPGGAPVGTTAGTLATLFARLAGTGTNTATANFYTPPSTTPAFPTVSSTGTPVVSPAPQIATAVASQAAAANALVTTSLQRVQAESQISQLSNTRVASETALVNMKMTEIQADMQRVQAHNDLMTRAQSFGRSPTSLEDLIQTTYQTRSRQGFAGFYGETSNPT